MPTASPSDALDLSNTSTLENEAAVAEILKNLFALHITDGCSQGCTHCFESPTRIVKIMPYHRIIQLLEIAKRNGFSKQIVDREITLFHTSESFDYYDPDADKDLGDVITAILSYFPEQKIDITTRGWYLGDQIGPRAAKKIAELMKQYPKKIAIRISIDLYNFKKDVARYIYRVCQLINSFPREELLTINISADTNNEKETKHVSSHILSLIAPHSFGVENGALTTKRVSQEGRAEKIETDHYHDVADCMYGIHIYPDGTVKEKIRLTDNKDDYHFVKVHLYKDLPLSLWNTAEAKTSFLPKNQKSSTVDRQALNKQLVKGSLSLTAPIDSFHLIQSKLKQRKLKKIINKLHKSNQIGSIWLGEYKHKEDQVVTFLQGLEFFGDFDYDNLKRDDHLKVALRWNTTYDLYIRSEDRELLNTFLYLTSNDNLIRASNYSLYIVPRKAKLESLSKKRKTLLEVKKDKDKLFENGILIKRLLIKDETLFPEIERKADDHDISLSIKKINMPLQKEKIITKTLLDKLTFLLTHKSITAESLKNFYISGPSSQDSASHVDSLLASFIYYIKIYEKHLSYGKKILKEAREKFPQIDILKLPPLKREKNNVIDPELEKDLDQFIINIKATEKIKSKEQLEKIKDAFLEFLKGNCEMFELVEALRQTGMSQKEAQELIFSYLMMDKEDEVIDLRLSRRSPLSMTVSQEAASLAASL